MVDHPDFMYVPEEERKPQKSPLSKIDDWLDETSPTEFYNRLTHRVLGQDEELRKASILIYGFLSSLVNHFNRKHPHFLIEGQSGCGKSTFASALAELLPIPVIVADASSITPAGFKGTDICDWISPIDCAGGYGILILDEIDKLMAPTKSSEGNFHLEALHSLLKVMDGGILIDRAGEPVHCGGILVIGMGAFTELREKISIKPMRKIGFCVDDSPRPSQKPSEPLRTAETVRGTKSPTSGYNVSQNALEAHTNTYSNVRTALSEPAKKMSREAKADCGAFDGLTTSPVIDKSCLSDFCGSEQFMGRFMTILHFKPLGRPMLHKLILEAEREIDYLYNYFGSGFRLTQAERSCILDMAAGTEFGARAIKAAVWEVFLQRGNLIPLEEKRQEPTLEDRWCEVERILDVGA